MLNTNYKDGGVMKFRLLCCCFHVEKNVVVGNLRLSSSLGPHRLFVPSGGNPLLTAIPK